MPLRPGRDSEIPPADEAAVTRAVERVRSRRNTLEVALVNNVESAGTFSTNPGTFNLQTHQPVPEPGSALLLMVAACAVGIRRTRSP